VARAAKTVLKHAGKAAAGVLPTALLAGLGMPALGALVFLAVLVLVVACWVIGSGDRTERVSRILLAGRGDANCLPPVPAGPSLPASRPRRWLAWRRRAGGPGSGGACGS
jgi:hypothetical protein